MGVEKRPLNQNVDLMALTEKTVTALEYSAAELGGYI